jgi:hypothetical protein
MSQGRFSDKRAGMIGRRMNGSVAAFPRAPLGRDVVGGRLAGLLITLVVVPAPYSLVVREEKSKDTDREEQDEERERNEEENPSEYD